MINLIRRIIKLLRKKRDDIFKIYDDMSSSSMFDWKYLDDRISQIVKNVKIKKKKINTHRVAFLATNLFDKSGASKCLETIIKELHPLYKQAIFITQAHRSQKDAPNTLKTLKKLVEISAIDCSLEHFEDEVRFLVGKLVEFAPKVLIVCMNPHDVFATAVLAIVRRDTNIKILYFNQASHWPLLGLSFAHFSIEASPLTARITVEQRHMNRYKIIPLPSLKNNETVYYSKDEIEKLKKKLNIPLDALVTLSGGSGYKFFDSIHDSKYFCMIRDLLNRDDKLYHVVMSSFLDIHKCVINKIFKDYPQLKQRLLCIPREDNFDIYFQMADVFIDSFPVSSALTQMDLMRNKVASVVKINNQNPMHSFHEYQMPGYPYMYSKISDMEEGILKLLHDPKAREDIIKKNYEYWLNKYEASVVGKKYIKLIEGL